MYHSNFQPLSAGSRYRMKAEQMEASPQRTARVFSLGVINVTTDDDGTYACFVTSSFLDNDKRVRFRAIRVRVEKIHNDGNIIT